MKSLPELSEMVPRVLGVVENYAGDAYLTPDAVVDAAKAPEHGIVRNGFRLFEILEWVEDRLAWRVRPFKATLNQQELAKLATRGTY